MVALERRRMARTPPAIVPKSRPDLQHREVLVIFLLTDERLMSAKKELLAFQDERVFSSVFKNAQAAKSWFRRVETWVGNLSPDITCLNRG